MDRRLAIFQDKIVGLPSKVKPYVAKHTDTGVFSVERWSADTVQEMFEAAREALGDESNGKIPS